MLLENPLTDRQPQPGALALGFGREERLEHPGGDVFGNPRPRVSHAHGDDVLRPLGRDPDPARRRVARDRLAGVVDQVHEHLLDLVGVHLHLGKARLHVQGRLDLVGHQLVADQHQRGVEQLVDRLAPPLALLAAGERQQVFDDGRRPLRLLTDHQERLLQRRRHPRLGQEVAEPHDGRERVVQVVGDARDELTDRRHFLRLYELLLQAPPLRLVLEHEHRGAGLGHRDGREEQRPLARADLDRGRGRLRDGPGDGVGPGRRQETEPRAARNRRDRHLDQLGEYAVGAPHRAERVHDANRLGDGVHGFLPFALGGRQQLDQARVLERDGALGEDQRHEGQLGLAERARPVARDRDRSHGASRGDEGRADPRAGRVAAQLGPAAARLLAHVARECEGSAPQRELQQGVVGPGRSRSEHLLLEQGPAPLLDEPGLLEALLAVRSLAVPSPPLFAYVAVRHALRAAAVDDRELADYLAALLLEFGDHDRHMRIRRADDESYSYLVDIVEDLTGLDDAGERGLLLRVHLGNYSLWFAGLFPDYIEARRTRKGGPDLPYYDEVGRQGYRPASGHRLAERFGVASIYRSAAERFPALRVAFNRLSDRVFFRNVSTPEKILRNL